MADVVVVEGDKYQVAQLADGPCPHCGASWRLDAVCGPYMGEVRKHQSCVVLTHDKPECAGFKVESLEPQAFLQRVGVIP